MTKPYADKLSYRGVKDIAKRHQYIVEALADLEGAIDETIKKAIALGPKGHEYAQECAKFRGQLSIFITSDSPVHRRMEELENEVDAYQANDGQEVETDDAPSGMHP